MIKISGSSSDNASIHASDIPQSLNGFLINLNPNFAGSRCKEQTMIVQSRMRQELEQAAKCAAQVSLFVATGRHGWNHCCRICGQLFQKRILG
jgi:hypothetical protein